MAALARSHARACAAAKTKAWKNKSAFFPQRPHEAEKQKIRHFWKNACRAGWRNGGAFSQ